SAARLSPSLGAMGEHIARKLAADPSPIVRSAALRSLRAWDDPAKSPASKPRKFDAKQWWQEPAPDLTDAAEKLHQAKEHDIVWRTLGRRVGYIGTPEAMKVLLTLDTAAEKTTWSRMV